MLVYLATRMIDSHFREKEWLIANNSALLYTCIWSIFLQISVKQPLTDSTRILLIGFTYFSLIIATLFQDHLANILTVPSYFGEITTLKNVHSIGFPITSFPVQEEVILKSENPILEKTMNRYRKVENVSAIMNQIP